MASYLSFELGAPLAKRNVGRQRKRRIKGCLKGGSKSSGKTKEKENGPKKTMIRGPIKCLRCGNLGHKQASYKCALHGTKKRQAFLTIFPYMLLFIHLMPQFTFFPTCRKRKPRKNKTKATKNDLTTPPKPTNTREAIMQESPGMVTRRCLAMLMGEGTNQSSMTASSPPKKTPPKKMTPKKRGTLEFVD